MECRLDGREVEVDAVLARPNVLSLRIGNKAYEVKCERVGSELHISVGRSRFAAEVRDPRSLRGRVRASDEQGPRKLTATMPGKVVRILVREGKEIEAGAGILVVEAMKMQNEVKSPKKGIIQKITSQRRGSGEFRRRSGDCRNKVGGCYFSIPLLSRTFLA